MISGFSLRSCTPKAHNLCVSSDPSGSRNFKKKKNKIEIARFHVFFDFPVRKKGNLSSRISSYLHVL